MLALLFNALFHRLFIRLFAFTALNGISQLNQRLNNLSAIYFIFGSISATKWKRQTQREREKKTIYKNSIKTREIKINDTMILCFFFFHLLLRRLKRSLPTNNSQTNTETKKKKRKILRGKQTMGEKTTKKNFNFTLCFLLPLSCTIFYGSSQSNQST